MGSYRILELGKSEVELDKELLHRIIWNGQSQVSKQFPVV